MDLCNWLLAAMAVLVWIDAIYTHKWLRTTRAQLKATLKLLEEVQHGALAQTAEPPPAPPSRA